MRCVQAWSLLRENLSHAPLSAPGGRQQSLAFVAYRDICSVSASVFSVSRPCVSSLLLIRTPVITGHPNPERPHFNLVTAPKTLFSQIRSHSGGPSEHEFLEGAYSTQYSWRMIENQSITLETQKEKELCAFTQLPI